ncbi:ABC transporter ATP-binding protein [Acidovorax sp. ACV01]|uniref:ABC transporter ATP-binding protein n=1 Tax=Acidovorax sp. ACV01 TaxID=2769311 RepID=UPI001782EF7F|nr:sn-glycerol-3-phosphate ABC transporter ATP-binding protein UgpC [Acidovorax sp. ACV01]MBD9391694.1 sn-glycerol-3-phosphate ABC transporter ATP-binding protein UgpC [Acidovorax sp. ACV01]
MSGLELNNVVKRFGDVTVVQQMDLTIHEGEFVVLLGESGCGKSTTLRMIAGLEEASEGKIFIAGRDVTNMAPMERDIAMVFQNYALYPHMDVAENMSFALRLLGRPKAEIAEKVGTAAKILSIEHLLNRKPKELSGGQRQRVAIGRAIVREPKVFLFDEPLSNLDAKLRGHMRAELAILHERLGKTTVYVTHDQIEAMTLASRIVIFDKGRIQQIGTPSEVFTRPASIFVAGFIGTPTMNFFKARYTQEHGVGLLRGEGFAWPAPDWLIGQSPRPDQALTLGIRPQAFRPSTSTGTNERPLLKLQVDVVEYLGTESQVVGHMNTPGGQRVAAMLSGNAQASLHQNIHLDFDPQDMHVFETDSGRSLRT